MKRDEFMSKRHKKLATKEMSNNPTKVKNKISTFLSDNITKSIAIISATVFVLSGFYKSSLYTYYGIDKTFLEFNIQDVFSIIILDLIILTVYIGIPILFWGICKSKEPFVVKIMVYFLLWLSYSLYFGMILYQSIKISCLKNGNADLIYGHQFWPIILIILIGFSGSILIFIGIKSYLKIQDPSNKPSWKRIVLFIVGFLVAIFISLSTFIYISCSFLSPDIGKEIYNTISIGEHQYVILTAYKDNIIIAPYKKIDELDTNLASGYNKLYDTIIFTNTYKITPVSQYQITYKYLGLCYVDKNTILEKGQSQN